MNISKINGPKKTKVESIKARINILKQSYIFDAPDLISQPILDQII